MTIGIGIIGPKRSSAGYGLGLYVAREILNCPDAELKALLGTSTASVHAASRLINAQNELRIGFKGHCYALTEALDFFARNDIDLVMICSPPPSHYDYVQEALERGRHVWVEKPLLAPDRTTPLDQRLDSARALFDQAQRQALWLSTNCQRVAALPVLEQTFGWPTDPGRVRLDLHVAARGGRLENRRDLFRLMAAHPLSLMVKWGAAWPQSLKIDHWHFQTTADRHQLEIQGHCRRPGGRMRFDLRLRQSCQPTPASIRLAVDDRQPVRISTEIGDCGRVMTCYQPEESIRPPVKGPDHLTLSVRQIIAAIAHSHPESRPLINNRESHLIYAAQERMEAMLFGFCD